MARVYCLLTHSLTCALQALEPNNAAAAAAAAVNDGSLEGGGRGGGGRDGRDGQQKLTMEELFPGLEPHQQDAKLQEVSGHSMMYS